MTPLLFASFSALMEKGAGFYGGISFVHRGDLHSREQGFYLGNERLHDGGHFAGVSARKEGKADADMLNFLSFYRS